MTNVKFESTIINLLLFSGSKVVFKDNKANITDSYGRKFYYLHLPELELKMNLLHPSAGCVVFKSVEKERTNIEMVYQKEGEFYHLSCWLSEIHEGRIHVLLNVFSNRQRILTSADLTDPIQYDFIERIQEMNEYRLFFATSNILIV